MGQAECAWVENMDHDISTRALARPFGRAHNANPCYAECMLQYAYNPVIDIVLLPALTMQVRCSVSQCEAAIFWTPTK
jgi:hypothetical protein